MTDKPAPREVKVYLHTLPLGGFIRAVDEADYLAACKERDDYRRGHAEFQRLKLEQVGLAEEFDLHGCDAVEWMADAIVALREENARLKAELAEASAVQARFHDRVEEVVSEKFALERKLTRAKAALERIAHSRAEGINPTAVRRIARTALADIEK